MYEVSSTSQQELQPTNALDVSAPQSDYQAPEFAEHHTTLTLARDAIRKEMGRCAKSIITIGWNLHRAKKECGHGLFLKWLDAEFGWSDRTARRFMGVADAFDNDANRTRVSNLEPTTLYLLAARSTPEDVREQVLSRFDAGEKLPAEEVRSLIKEAKPKRSKPSRRHSQATPPPALPETKPVDRLEEAKRLVRSLSTEEFEQFTKWFRNIRGIDEAAVKRLVAIFNSWPKDRQLIALDGIGAERGVPEPRPEPEQVAGAPDVVDEPEQVEAVLSDVVDVPEQIAPKVAEAEPEQRESEPDQSMSELDQTTLRVFREHAATNVCPWIGVLVRNMWRIDEGAVQRLAAGGHLVPSPGDPNAYGVRVEGPEQVGGRA